MSSGLIFVRWLSFQTSGNVIWKYSEEKNKKESTFSESVVLAGIPRRPGAVVSSLTLVQGFMLYRLPHRHFLLSMKLAEVWLKWLLFQGFAVCKV